MPNDSPKPRRAFALWPLGLLLALVVSNTGCSHTRWLKVRPVPHNMLAEQLKVERWAGPELSPRTQQTLRRYDMPPEFPKDPKGVLTQLRDVVRQDSSPEALYSYAELSYLSGRTRESKDAKLALDYYVAAVAHSYWYLFDPRLQPIRNPYDPQYRAACDVYNEALERAMRLVQSEGALKPGVTHTIETAKKNWRVTVVPRDVSWDPDEIERFEFVSDYEVAGFNNYYRTYGLGVPLIAIRKDAEKRDGGEQFYPHGLTFPVTAFLRLMPEGDAQRRGEDAPHQCWLELYDPLRLQNIAVHGGKVTLETDLSTPLAFFLEKASFEPYANLGLLHPDESDKDTGLYLTEPYQPGKIPVVFVHGLWSDPSAWSEMLNELRSAPEIRQQYQFWLYLYPTGQPFWYSAAELRSQLAAMQDNLDPNRANPGLQHMVMVGHSMGGLISKLQTVQGGDDYWNAVAKHPLSEVKASPEVLASLRKTFYFEANPAVERVIAIGSPHKGSNLANSATKWVFSKLISLPETLVRAPQELYQENPDLFREEFRGRTSIDTLSTESPLLPVLYGAPKPPAVKYHTIVGVTTTVEDPDASDGVVALASARLPNAASELVVHEHHMDLHRNPRSVLEVRRILLEHLQDLRQRQPIQGPDQGPKRLLVDAPPLPPPRAGNAQTANSGNRPLSAPLSPLRGSELPGFEPASPLNIAPDVQLPNPNVPNPPANQQQIPLPWQTQKYPETGSSSIPRPTQIPATQGTSIPSPFGRFPNQSKPGLGSTQLAYPPSVPMPSGLRGRIPFPTPVPP